MTGTMPEHRHQPTTRRNTSMASVSASEKSPTISAETARNTENIIRRPKRSVSSPATTTKTAAARKDADRIRPISGSPIAKVSLIGGIA